ncbi:MAG: glycoside hydrolase family 18 protein [Pirellulales bacterium]
MIVTFPKTGGILVAISSRTLMTVALLFGLSNLYFGRCAADEIPQRDANKFAVVGYLPDYRMSVFEPATAEGVTDLVFFSVEPTSSGDLDTRSLSKKNLALLKSVKEKNNCRIHLGVGGWGRSNHFAAMSSQKQSRQRFVNNLEKLCQRYGFDGADLDWEFPDTKAEKASFVALLRDLREKFRRHGMLLSIAAAGLQDLPGEAVESVDKIHLMAYDAAGRHATFADAQKFVQRLIDRKVPPNKICLGLPLYGRGIKRRNIALGYAQIVERHHPGANIDEVAGIYFNGVRTIENKTAFAQQAKLGGVMFWEITLDTRDETSLIRAVLRTMQPKK